MRADNPSRRLRDTLAHVPTGVVVATMLAEAGSRLGMTMNSFASVSLDPPLVLFSIDRRSLGLSAWLTASGYAINILSSSQAALANRFARACADKWTDVE